MQSSWSELAEILLSRVCMLLEERPRWWKPVRVWCEVILRTVIRYISNTPTLLLMALT